MSVYAANEERVIKFIAAFWREHQYPPSVREIGDHLGFASTSTTHFYLHRLMEKGRISFVPGKARTIRVLT